ncbi:YhbY family RNA-binding protein [Candidatus Poseidoniales archaeon]|nr:YhbY family RNA-binding protein [Candidatus Poseidoniales archaeon]
MTSVCSDHRLIIWSNYHADIVFKFRAKHGTCCVANAMHHISLVSMRGFELSMVSESSHALNAPRFEGLAAVPNLTARLENIPKFRGSIFLNNSPQGCLSAMSRDIPASIRREAQSREFPPSIRIGKSGITENLIDEIDGQLNTRTLVKIKINRGLFERKDIDAVWSHLAKETNSTLVLARGNVGVLWR